MAINQQTGLYGIFFGSYLDESDYLTTDTHLTVNARYIERCLDGFGWSRQSIAAILGNMEVESTLNPGIWQNHNIGNNSGGYGLVQWTPATKYFEWCTKNNYLPYTMDAALLRIIYELNNNLQWIATNSYNFSFEEFSKSNKSAGELARAFMLNYERPADQSETNQAYRSAMANRWYKWLSGEGMLEPPDIDDPSNPTTPTTKSKRKKGYNFLILNRRRRMEQWIKRSF